MLVGFYQTGAATLKIMCKQNISTHEVVPLEANFNTFQSLIDELQKSNDNKKTHEKHCVLRRNRDKNKKICRK